MLRREVENRSEVKVTLASFLYDCLLDSIVKLFIFYLSIAGFSFKINLCSTITKSEKTLKLEARKLSNEPFFAENKNKNENEKSLISSSSLILPSHLISLPFPIIRSSPSLV